MLESLITRWGYAALSVGVFLEGESIVLVAGAMAHRGLLSLPIVITCSFAASLLGDQAWFFLGHRYGRDFIARRPGWQRRTRRAEALLTRYGTLFVLAFRFMYGFRTITPAFLGAIGYPLRRFAILNALAAAIWAVTFSIAGYAVGATLVSILGRAGRIEEIALAVGAVAIAVWLLSRRASSAATIRSIED